MILAFINLGFTDKQKIYDEIRVKHPEIPRPTIRRACRELRLELQAQIFILQSHRKQANKPNIISEPLGESKQFD